MGYTLGLSTASDTGSVAIIDDSACLSLVTYDGALGHAESLLTAVSAALRDAGISLSELSCVGVCTGPGSFTGTRVALATAKGLHFVTGVPLYGITATRAISAGRGDCAVVIDARRGEVFLELFSAGTGDGPRLLSIPDARVLVEGRAAFGTGASLVAETGVLSEPSAKSVATLALLRHQVGKPDDPQNLEPAYLREPDFGTKPGVRALERAHASHR